MKKQLQASKVIFLQAYDVEKEDGLIVFHYDLYMRYGRARAERRGYTCHSNRMPEIIAIILKENGHDAFQEALVEAKKLCDQIREAQPWA